MTRRVPPDVRRGSAYVFVLGVTLLVTVLGLGTLSLSRVTLRATADGNDWETAGTLAFSAAEHAVSLLNAKAAASPNGWRADYVSGRTAFAQAVGRGLFAWSVVDETDGDLAADYLRGFRVYGVGVCGGVRRVYSVRMVPAGTPLDVLRTAVHSASTIRLTGNARAAGGPVSSNNKVTLSGTVNAAIEAASTAGTAAGTQSVTAPAPAKVMPSASLLDALSSRATAVGDGSGDVVIEKCLLSPASNPFGPPNADGLYWVKLPVGKKLTITKCRVVGTLLVSGPGGNAVEIKGPVSLEPGPLRGPTLLAVSPGMEVTFEGTPKWLSEADAATNLNPAHTPYAGESNATQADDFPPHYRGLFHVAGGSGGKVNLKANAYFSGTLVTDCPVETSGQFTAVRDASFYDDPPYGYAAGDALAQVPGTWRWDALPAGMAVGPARTAAEATASAAAVSR